MTDNPVNSARTAIEVSHLYGFLAALYRREIDAAMLDQLRSKEIRASLREAGVELGESFEGADEAALLEALAVEYTALFLGPGEHISPHESVHAEGGGGSLWGDETVAVRRFIQEAGFEYSEDYDGVPDHISVELEFMAEAARREAIAWEEGDAAMAANCLEFQREFLNEHLGKWVPQFCDKVSAVASVPLYRDIAKLTTSFVRSELADVDGRLAAARKASAASASAPDDAGRDKPAGSRAGG